MRIANRFSKWISWFAGLSLFLVLSACGGTGGDTDLAPTNSVGTSGIAVDPYIIGAQFEEVSADGLTLIQRQSTLSDSAGRFSFAEPAKEGSIIRIKQGAKGTHAGAPFTGMIKRRVSADDDETLVVSPLTTLLANGMSADDIILMMNEAGLPGLTPAQLTADPMAGLENTTAVSNAMLLPLQANMAANAYMEAINDFDFCGLPQAQAPPGLHLADMVQAVTQTLNANIYQELSTSIDGGLTLGDLIQTAARLHRTIITQVKQELAANDQSLPPGRMAQAIAAALVEAPNLAREIHQGRVGTAPPPGGEPITAPQVDGAALFAQLCAGCHTLAGGSGLMDLAGDGAKIAAKFSATHMGRNLTSAEQSAVAAHLNGQSAATPPTTGPGTGPTPPAPGVPPTGAELYAAECQGCHGNLQNSNIADRTPAGISGAIDANLGGMGFIVLSDAEIQAIAAALPVLAPSPAPPAPPAPPQDRDGQTVYQQECAACHALGSFDTTGSINLAGLGTTVLGKLQAGHMGKNPSQAERNALAAFIDSVGGPAPSEPPPAPVPPTPPTPPTPTNYADCAACHGSKPTNTSGAHAAHLGVPAIAGNCNICHDENNHAWGTVDILADFDATASRPATFNTTGTCSNISCHGGVQTPAWATGVITVNAECQKCHTAGSAVYSDYSSGRHSKHRNFACASCHDTNKLALNHFGNLGTKQFEQSPASTLLANLNYVNNNCTINCHGKNHNPLRW